LPYQITPLIVAMLVHQSRASISEAGAIASAILVGQLVSSIVLPKRAGIATRSRFMIASTALLVVGLWLTVVHTLLFAITGWFLVGVGCGALVYMGTIVSAQQARRKFAFTLRLGVAAILTGLVAGLLWVGLALENYDLFIAIMTAFYFAVLLAGVFLTRTAAVAPLIEKRPNVDECKISGLVGLSIAYLLFTGQAGFAAFALQQGGSHGIGMEDAVWTLVIVNLIAGCGLLLLARREVGPCDSEFSFAPSGLLAISIATMSLTTNLAAFFIGYLILKIALNALSAQLRAKVAEVSPSFGARWLPAAILLGAATGPWLNGLAIACGAAKVFLVFAIASALVPPIWALLVCHRQSSGRFGWKKSAAAGLMSRN